MLHRAWPICCCVWDLWLKLGWQNKHRSMFRLMLNSAGTAEASSVPHAGPLANKFRVGKRGHSQGSLMSQGIFCATKCPAQQWEAEAPGAEEGKGWDVWFGVCFVWGFLCQFCLGSEGFLCLLFFRFHPSVIKLSYFNSEVFLLLLFLFSCPTALQERERTA